MEEREKEKEKEEKVKVERDENRGVEGVRGSTVTFNV